MIALRTLAAKYSFRALVLVAVLSLAGSTVAAIPIYEYHEKLERVIAGVKALLDTDEEESAADYEARFSKAIEAIRSELPKNQQVELELGTCNADNSGLHTALDELQRAPAEERPAKLESLLETLRAVDERVAELETAEKVEDNKAAAKGTMQGILSRPEYASGQRGENALARLIRDFFRWFQNLFPAAPEIEPGRASTISRVVQIVVVLTALLLILYVARLLLMRFRRTGKVKVRKKREARIVLGERLRPEDTATDLLAEAEALARDGDLRAAIRKGYIALLVELGDRNVISLAQHKTNQDYLRSVSNLPQLHPPLKRLTESFEQHWYGFAQATPNDWQEFRAGYREALQTGN